MNLLTTTKLFYVVKSLMATIMMPATLISIIHSSSTTKSTFKLKVGRKRLGSGRLHPDTAALSSDQTNNNNDNNNNPTNTFFPDTSTIVGNPICPGSPASTNAKCIMTIQFPKPFSCAMVQTEITSRMNGDNGWVDPHHHGTYTIINDHYNYEEKITQITGSRVTGHGNYTDLFIFTLEEDKNVGGSGGGNGGCILSSCSESQVFSVLDFSTNYCNLHNLYCNKSNDGCEIVKYDLNYQETYIDCWQRDPDKCIATGDDYTVDPNE